jgi:hypothetical protein
MDYLPVDLAKFVEIWHEYFFRCVTTAQKLAVSDYEYILNNFEIKFKCTASILEFLKFLCLSIRAKNLQGT